MPMAVVHPVRAMSLTGPAGNNACFTNGRFRSASRKTRTHDIRRGLADPNGGFGAYNSNKRTFGKGTCELRLLTRSSHSTEHISKYCKI
jgi:hypothetical protein